MKIMENNIILKLKHTLKLLILITAMILPSACESDLLESPPHLMTTNALFQDRAGFEAAVNGLYSYARRELVNSSSAAWDITKVGTDGYVANHDHSSNSFSFFTTQWGGLINPDVNKFDGLWTLYYRVINTANHIISQANREDVPLSEADKNLFLADAKAVRAWAYRHLTYLFGDVPLSLQPSSGATIRRDWTRTSVAEVREQMIEDWLFAVQHLPVESTLAGRMTKGAAEHYLAEMYIVKGGYAEAISWADRAINNPSYSLITERFGDGSGEPGVPFMDMFRDENANREDGNTEALWVKQFAEGVTGGELYNAMKRKHMSRYHSIVIDGVNPLRATANRGGEGRARTSLTKWALDLYEPQDDRGSEYAIRKYFILQDAEGNSPMPADRLPPGWNYGDTLHLDWSEDITAATRNRTTWPWSRKVDWANPATPGMRENYKNVPYLRLAETYLLKAEAQYLNGDPDGAAETLNVIRRRANASEIDVSAVDIDFILDERQRELAIEEQRRYTLIRTGKLVERTRLYNNYGGEFITERDIIFPVPQEVIDANETEFPQNPGF